MQPRKLGFEAEEPKGREAEWKVVGGFKAEKLG